MKVPNTEEIQEACKKEIKEDYTKRQIIRGSEYETGFKKGAEWMEEQLEPIITELEMDTLRMKDHKWYPLNKGYYPTASLVVWLWADDGKDIADGYYNSRINKFEFGHNDTEGYNKDRKFTHWQQKYVPEPPKL